MANPSFPAVLVLHGDDELIYLPDAAAWHDEAGHTRLFPGQDRLIDVQGRSFAPIPPAEGAADPADEGAVTLAEFEQLLRRHLFAQAQTCVSKAGIGSFAEGIAVVGQG